MNTLIKRFLLMALLMAPSALFAQKYACVNTDKVLKNVPDYAQAQKRLDKYVEQWQTEIEEKYQELETMRQNYQKEAYLLPENLKKRREEDIKEKNQEILQLQQQHFSPGGDFDKKREELLKPVQDRIAAAIDRFAREKGYAFVFDKSVNSTILFVNEKYDITNALLEALGYQPDSNAEENGSAKTPSKTTPSRTSSKNSPSKQNKQPALKDAPMPKK